MPFTNLFEYVIITKKEKRDDFVEYKVIYSNRKTIGITVKNEEVAVKVPLKTKPEKIKEVVEKYSEWINKQLNSQKKKADLFKDLDDDKIKRLKKDAKIYFEDRTEYFANIMGLKYGRVKITSAQKRYGSCSSEGNICYSYRLMMYPPEVRDYVVVHELAHLKEMNHSKRFYDVVASVMPDYKRRRRYLK